MDSDVTPKIFIMIGVTLGTYAGSLVASWFGADFFSFWGVIASAIGGILVIALIYKFVLNN